MNKHRYILEPYKGMNTRYTCPSCKKREFTRYIDSQTGQYVNSKVGRCNRENNCSYHYTPKQYFEDNHIAFEKAPEREYKPNVVTPQRKPSFLSVEILKDSLNNHQPNNFIKFLLTLFGADITQALISRYFIGTHSHFGGAATVFWQIDSMGRVHTGKIMQYDAITGKRVKKPYDLVTWVHSLLKQPEFVLKQCLFGEHLLKDKTKPVAICESEKTAVIASVYFPNLIWLAVGGMEKLNAEICSPLLGRNVVLFPDINGFEKWSIKAKELSHLATFSVSDLLERKATDTQRQQGLDLADYLIKLDYKDFLKPEQPQQPAVEVHKVTPTMTPGKFQKENKPKRGNWKREIAELENYFKSHELPSGPVRVNPWTVITNVTLFVDSNLATIKFQNGNERYRPYLEQLKEFVLILN